MIKLQNACYGSKGRFRYLVKGEMQRCFIGLDVSLFQPKFCKVSSELRARPYLPRFERRLLSSSAVQQISVAADHCLISFMQTKGTGTAAGKSVSKSKARKQEQKLVSFPLKRVDMCSV